MTGRYWLLLFLVVCMLPRVATAQQQPTSSPGEADAAPAAPALERPTGSLWSRSARPLVADRKAAKVGDVLTIIVQETASAASSAATKTSRADKTEFGGLNSGFSTLNRLLKPFDVSASGSTNGQGQTNRSGSLVTKISVTVKEVLEDGNLRVEGTREVTINKEKQKVTIRGIVRPDDIGPGNTVSSVAVADASIQYDGKGPVGDRQRKGLLSTVFDWLF